MILYKYFSQDRIGFLSDRLVRITQPGAFNDPFDSTAAHLSEEDLSSAGISEDDCCWRARVHVVQTMMNMMDIGSIGVLCLSERADSLLMWSHYAEAHRGFVVGFDTTDDFFALATKDGGILRKVNYSSARVARALDVDEQKPSLFFIDPSSERLSLSAEWLFTKSVEWQYEEEWRLVKWLDAPDLIIDQKDRHPINLYRVPPSAIHSVVIGCRGWNDLFPRIKAIIEADYALEHIRLFEASASDYDFRVLISEFPGGGIPYRPWALSLGHPSTERAGHGLYPPPPEGGSAQKS